LRATGAYVASHHSHWTVLMQRMDGYVMSVRALADELAMKGKCIA